VEVAFTDRFGGTSPGPYAELNLLASGEEDPARVEEHLDLLVRALEQQDDAPGGEPARAASRARVVVMRQVHGADVVVVDGEAAPAEPVGDALVTATPGTVLAARAADCVPVLLADPARRVVAAVHAGRAGLVGGVVPNAAATLRRLGAEELVAWVGPHAGGRCYEVPSAMRAEVAAAVPESWSETSWGTPALDLAAGVRAQLAAASAEVVETGRCTIEDDAFYSYRRQGPASGRHAGLIWVRP
jgi:YfiH family protein